MLHFLSCSLSLKNILFQLNNFPYYCTVKSYTSFYLVNVVEIVVLLFLIIKQQNGLLFPFIHKLIVTY